MKYSKRKKNVDYLDSDLENTPNVADYLGIDLENVQNSANYPDRNLCAM